MLDNKYTFYRFVEVSNFKILPKPMLFSDFYEAMVNLAVGLHSNLIINKMVTYFVRNVFQADFVKMLLIQMM